MNIIGAVLLFATLSQSDSLTPSELTRALAGAEQSLSERYPLEVTYHTVTEWRPGVKPDGQKPEPATITWITDGDQVFFSQRFTDREDSLLTKWYFEGQTTREWSYSPTSPELLQIIISNGPPRFPTRLANRMASLIGWDRPGMEDGLLGEMRDAKTNGSITGRRSKEHVILSLGLPARGRVQHTFHLTVDPARDYDLVSWSMHEHLDNNQTPSVFHYEIDEYQLVTDEATGRQRTFPKRAHHDDPFYTTTLTVDSVRFPKDIPAEVFQSPTPPIGTSLVELSPIPGALPRKSVYGGNAAHEKKLAEITRAAEKELATLEETGTIHDATPNSNNPHSAG